ncbi:MAG: hypothetical protein ABL857_04800, partial [Rickettsiales bacterium]
ISASNSRVFRNSFYTKLEKLFVVPADTFDNVKGNFPIGFFIWNTSEKERFTNINADVFGRDGNQSGNKFFYSYDNVKGKINDWLASFKSKEKDSQIGFLMADAPDFQHNNLVRISSTKPRGHGIFFALNQYNLPIACIYLAVRHAIDATWLNDRDQFLYPSDGWKNDTEFQNNCLAFTLFSNNIQSQFGINHWIPFSEDEVKAGEKFASHFMTKFINGKLKYEAPVQMDGLSTTEHRTTPLEFSAEATAVFDAGRELYKYYHSQANCNVNASLYDIREHFQGRNEAGKMNNKSDDEVYSFLIKDIRDKLKLLQKAIEPKIYEYGFLK